MSSIAALTLEQVGEDSQAVLPGDQHDERGSEGVTQRLFGDRQTLKEQAGDGRGQK